MAFPDLTDIRSRLRTILKESTTAMWSDAELNTLINDGERDIAFKTGCIENVDTAATTANTRAVTFSGLGVNHVEFVPASGNPVGLRRITVQHFGRVKLSGIMPQYYAVWGSNILIEPIPTKIYNLNVYVADYPASFMANSTDEPTIPKEFHEDIILYAAYRALMKNGKFLDSWRLYGQYDLSLRTKMGLMDREQTGDKLYALPDGIVEPQEVVTNG